MIVTLTKRQWVGGAKCLSRRNYRWTVFNSTQPEMMMRWWCTTTDYRWLCVCECPCASIKWIITSNDLRSRTYHTLTVQSTFLALRISRARWDTLTHIRTSTRCFGQKETEKCLFSLMHRTHAYSRSSYQLCSIRSYTRTHGRYLVHHILFYSIRYSTAEYKQIRARVHTCTDRHHHTYTDICRRCKTPFMHRRHFSH